MKELFNKHKEVILYLIFGVLTTLVSISTFYILSKVLNMHELVANIFSWIIAVSFAYYTNSKWVFESNDKGIKSISKFFAGRLFTLAVEEVILLVFVTFMKCDEMVIKVIAQVIIIILNYVISKWFVFK